MKIRQNIYFEEIAKKAAGMSAVIAKKATAIARRKAFKAASNMMIRAGMPHMLIERILYEPHNIRASDFR